MDMKRLKNLFLRSKQEPATPALLRDTDFAVGDVGSFAWDPASSDILSITEDGLTVWWDTSWSEGREDVNVPAWLGATTQLHLHSGRFTWDFVIEEMASAQIGVGVMLLWNVGPDWGFFGYLGSSPTAWSYDPSTGDVVTNAESISSGLGRIEKGEAGVVSVAVELPRKREGSLRFGVGGVWSPSVALPPGSVVQPAVSLLAPSQRVGFDRFSVWRSRRDRSRGPRPPL
jgi:hypothetical protein